MNDTTKALIVFLVLIGALIGYQQMNQPKPEHAHDCGSSGGG